MKMLHISFFFLYANIFPQVHIKEKVQLVCSIPIFWVYCVNFSVTKIFKKNFNWYKFDLDTDKTTYFSKTKISVRSLYKRCCYYCIFRHYYQELFFRLQYLCYLEMCCSSQRSRKILPILSSKCERPSSVSYHEI